MTDRVSWPEVFGQEAWDNAREMAVDNEGDFQVTEFLDALVKQGALRESVRRSVDMRPDLRQYVSVWREVTE